MEKNASFSSKSLFSSREKLEAAKIATTLALACVMDQVGYFCQFGTYLLGFMFVSSFSEVPFDPTKCLAKKSSH